MRSLSRCASVVALFLLACGGKGSSSNVASTIGDGAASEGDEAGVPGRRGGGGGAFGGSEDGGAPDDGAASDAVVGADAPIVVVLDGGRDRPPRDNAAATDLSGSPDVIAVTDVATTGNPCADGTCDAFETDYQTALARARSCTPGTKVQCQVVAPTGLRCPGCGAWVNSRVELDDLRTKWTNAGCAKCSSKFCPLIACPVMSSGTCSLRRLASPGDNANLVPQPPVEMGVCTEQNGIMP